MLTALNITLTVNNIEIAGNDIVKFAHDIYLIIPAKNTDASAEELDHVQAWASHNNLQLNCSKSQEIIFQSTQRTRMKSSRQMANAGFPEKCPLKWHICMCVLFYCTD